MSTTDYQVVLFSFYQNFREKKAQHLGHLLLLFFWKADKMNRFGQKVFKGHLVIQ